MILLIHDLPEQEGERLVAAYEQTPVVVANDGTIKHCLGCFGCWTKDPGVCVLQDKYKANGALMGHASEVHIVSHCFYGGFSPFVKNVLDRSISYVHPDLRMREGKTHHRLRYAKPFQLQVCFYGANLTDQERETAEKLVKANVINMGCILAGLKFVENSDRLVEGGA